MPNKTFFVVGLRRSGTSILRQLILKNKEVGDIDFEPHEINHAASVIKISGYKSNPYYNRVISSFKSRGKFKWYGAKIVYNPGVDAMDWIWLPSVFDETKFIFITRNAQSNYKSYFKADKNIRRGVIPKEAYIPLHKLITDSFKKFNKNNPQRACIVDYDNMLKDSDGELSKVWNLLGINKVPVQKFIKKPQN